MSARRIGVTALLADSADDAAVLEGFFDALDVESLDGIGSGNGEESDVVDGGALGSAMAITGRLGRKDVGHRKQSGWAEVQKGERDKDGDVIGIVVEKAGMFMFVRSNAVERGQS